MDTEALLLSRDELTALFGETRADVILSDTAGWPLAVFNENLFSLDTTAMGLFLQSEMYEAMLTAALLKQSAEEMGDVHTNKQKVDHASRDGSLLAPTVGN